jgi:hypothetical protein
VTIVEALKETYSRLENGSRWMVWHDNEWLVLTRLYYARENMVLYSGTDEEAAVAALLDE